jgi:hypothetical protein
MIAQYAAEWEVGYHCNLVLIKVVAELVRSNQEGI